MTFLRTITRLLLLTALLAVPSASYGSGASFQFKNVNEIADWRFVNVESASVADDGLLLRGSRSVIVLSPPGFKAPPGANVLRLRFRSSKGLACNIRVNTFTGGVVEKSIRVRGSGEVQDFRFYLGSLKGGDDYINKVEIQFYTIEKVRVALISAGFYRPTLPGLSRVLWEEFLRPDMITNFTVASVTTPMVGGLTFLSALYILIILLLGTAFGVVFFTRKGARRRRSFLKAFILVFLVGGFVFAVRMDYNWLMIWRGDAAALHGEPVGVRIREVNNRDLDNFLDFMDFMESTVPAGKTIAPAALSADSPLAAMARYYLLPMEVSSEPDFLWSFADKDLRLDASSGVLYRGGKKASAPVRVFKEFAANAVIFEVLK
ncbi:MAG: hypothetical protein ACE5EB_03235 [Thermodesulfobacteriota bacterium]